MIRNIDEIYEHQIGDDPTNWVDENVKEKDLIPYSMPDKEDLKCKNNAFIFCLF